LRKKWREKKSAGGGYANLKSREEFATRSYAEKKKKKKISEPEEKPKKENAPEGGLNYFQGETKASAGQRGFTRKI